MRRMARPHDPKLQSTDARSTVAFAKASPDRYRLTEPLCLCHALVERTPEARPTPSTPALPLTTLYSFPITPAFEPKVIYHQQEQAAGLQARKPHRPSGTLNLASDGGVV